MFEKFKCKDPTQVQLNGVVATVRASLYRSSQDHRLKTEQLDPGLLRFYEVSIADQKENMLVSELELRVLLGEKQFNTLL